MKCQDVAHDTTTHGALFTLAARRKRSIAARRKRLLALVLERGPEVRNGEMAQLLGVSVHTVQLDLAHLAAGGAIEIRGTRTGRRIYQAGRVPAEAPPARAQERRPPRSQGLRVVHGASAEVRRRKCLGCKRSFESGWVGHRICDNCKAKPSWSSPTAATASQHGL